MTTEHNWPVMSPQLTESFLISYFNSMPPGHRFYPTDEELIEYYLKNKVLNLSLPLNRIKEVNIYDYNPQQLYDMYKIEGEKYMYFFSSRDRKYPKGKRPKRSAADGYWKATGVDHLIKKDDIVIGHRKGLVFYQGTHKDSVKTNWIMYEYQLASNTADSCNKKLPNPSTSNTAAPIDMRLDDCVLYRIHKKPEKAEEDANDVASDNVDSTGTNPSEGNALEIVPPTSLAPKEINIFEESDGYTIYFSNAELAETYDQGINYVPNNTTGSAANIVVPCLMPRDPQPLTHFDDFPWLNIGDIDPSNPPAFDP